MKSCLPPGVRGCECMSQASEAGVCVSYQCRLIFVYRGWMGGGGGGERGCRPYLLAYELVQTQVDMTCRRCW